MQIIARQLLPWYHLAHLATVTGQCLTEAEPLSWSLNPKRELNLA